jgi:hypothetical protein
MRLIKKDNYILGFLIGLAFPMMIIGLIFILGILLGQPDILIVNRKLYLLGVIMNLLFLRLYIVAFFIFIA